MWWQVLFWALLVPVLIVMGIVYGTSKKLHRLFYILATFTYVIFIAYIIDVFSLGRNWILGLLVFSAVLMLLLGYWLTTHPEKGGKRRAKGAKGCLAGLAVLILLMLLLIILGSLDVGLTREVEVVDSLSLEEVLRSTARGIEEPSVTAAEITYTNEFFLPRVIADHQYVACWYDSEEERVGTDYLEVSVDGKRWLQEGEALPEVAPGASRLREVRLGSTVYPEKPIGVPAEENATRSIPEQYRGYDAIIVAAGPERVECMELLEQREEMTLFLTIPVTD